MYDITSPESFASVGQWIEDARALRDVDQAFIVLAGNKADMDEERQVSYEEALSFAQEKDI